MGRVGAEPYRSIDPRRQGLVARAGGPSAGQKPGYQPGARQGRAARSGHGRDVVGAKALAAGRADQTRLELAAAGVVAKQDWRALLRLRPAVAPGRERDQDRHEIAPGFRQDIFETARPLLISAAEDHSILLQALEPARQQIARHAEVFGQRVEPFHAEEEIAQDERRPPVADPFQGPRQRTAHFRETRSFHARNLVSCIIERNRAFSGSFIEP